VIVLLAVYSKDQKKKKIEIEMNLNKQPVLIIKSQCPFAQKVLKHLEYWNANLIIKDIASNPTWHEQIIKATGKTQTPCLVYEHDGRVHYQFESDEIVAVLTQMARRLRWLKRKQ